MRKHALWAIFRRNFAAYFSTPTGYVFICVFALLSSFAAFWPDEFFTANLANLDQLNQVFPLVMLVFVPAVTMSVWADERRHGTDELLLTLPATDQDVVLGKYLAAVAIYSVALVFSTASCYVVLQTLGNPDPGLFAANVLGYWLAGLAMLAVAMVASFLTANVTVAFILGAALNAPLVFASRLDVVLGDRLAGAIAPFGLAYSLRDFYRGVVNLWSLAYFLGIVAVMLYLCMVLIGRRHWVRGRRWGTMAVHYAVRTVAIAAMAAGLVLLLKRYDRLRLDVTSGRLNSLSPQTASLLDALETDAPVVIDAYVSPQVPEAYVQTRLDLLTMLRELQARWSGKIRVHIHPTELHGEEAARAQRRFGIEPQQVLTLSRGAWRTESIYLAAAFTRGLNRVVVPFFARGVPLEYELVRSIATAAEPRRKTIGVLTHTPLRLLRNPHDPDSYDHPIVDQWRKQYEVVAVNPFDPIPAPGDAGGKSEPALPGENPRCDVLVAVQPSALSPREMDHLWEAIASGLPVLILEDPLPAGEFFPGVPGTAERDTGPVAVADLNFFRVQAPPEVYQRDLGASVPVLVPRGSVSDLWDLLGVHYAPRRVLVQDYNPYPKVEFFEGNYLFVDKGSGADEPLNREHQATAPLERVLFRCPGAFSKQAGATTEFTPLVTTGPKATPVGYESIFQRGPRSYRLVIVPEGPRGEDASLELDPGALAMWRAVGAPPVPLSGLRLLAEPYRAPVAINPLADWSRADTDRTYHVVARVRGERKLIDRRAPSGTQARVAKINAALVADVDLFDPSWLQWHQQGGLPEFGVSFYFDDVELVLNLVDTLTGEKRFFTLRARRARHRTLTRIEAQVDEAREQAAKARKEFRDEYEQSLAAAGSGLNEARRRRVERTFERKMNAIETELTLKTRRIRDAHRLWAVVLPPVLPLVVAMAVFVMRRRREREGVAAERLRG